MNLTDAIKINVDKNKFKEVFLNLIENAVTYSPPESTIEISTKTTHDQNDNLDELKILISDQGQGIPEDKQAKIWQRFYKLDKARKRDNKEGSGLGLSIVKEIIDKHEAEIEVKNNPEKSCTFTITLEGDNLL